MLRRLVHHFIRAVASLKKAMFINLITVATITIALLLLAGYLLLLNNLNHWINVSQQRFTIKAFVHDDVVEKKLGEIAGKIRSYSNVRDAKVLDKNQAKDIFIDRHPDFLDIIEGLNENPFQASILIRVENDSADSVKQIATKVEKIAGVESVDYGERWLERYLAFRGTVKMGSYLLASLIIIACIFLVSNTIRLNIFTRRAEIEIYKLVGGTKIFIATPFVIEGAALGLCGAALAIAMLFVFFKLTLLGMNRESIHMMSSLTFYFLNNTGILLLLAVGVVSGTVGSILSLHRFLRI